MRKLFLFLALLTQSIFICTSFAQTGWVSLNMPQRNYKSINFINSLTGYIFSQDGYIEKTTDGGNTWSETNTGLVTSGSMYSGNFKTPMFGTLAGEGKIYTTTNGGNNWIFSNPSYLGYLIIRKSSYLDNTIGYSSGADMIPSETSQNLNTIPSDNFSSYTGYLYKTSNTGITWSPIFNVSFGDVIDYNIKNEDSITVLTSVINRTTDGGQKWDSSGFHLFIYYRVTSFTNPYKDTMFVSGDYRIIRSTDMGETWNLMYTNNSFHSLNKISFLNSKTGYCAGDSGTMLYTSNSGFSWIKQRTFLSKRLNDIAIINKDTIFAVGENGVVIRTYNGGLTSASQQTSLIPKNFVLFQNYPNPFNPNTIISYKLSVAGYISLNVYDATGRLIKILESGFRPAGIYNTNFSAEGLSSGVYYYSLSADGVLMDTKKSVVIK